MRIPFLVAILLGALIASALLALLLRTNSELEASQA